MKRDKLDDLNKLYFNNTPGSYLKNPKLFKHFPDADGSFPTPSKQSVIKLKPNSSRKLHTIDPRLDPLKKYCKFSGLIAFLETSLLTGR